MHSRELMGRWGTVVAVGGGGGDGLHLLGVWREHRSQHRTRSGSGPGLRAGRKRPQERAPSQRRRLGRESQSGSLHDLDAANGDVLGQVQGVGAGAHDVCLAERAGKAFVTAETINAVDRCRPPNAGLRDDPRRPAAASLRTFARRTHDVHDASRRTRRPWARRSWRQSTPRTTPSRNPTSANAAARTHGPHPSPDGDTIYVAHDTGDEVTAVDAETGGSRSASARYCAPRKLSRPGSATSCGRRRGATAR